MALRDTRRTVVLCGIAALALLCLALAGCGAVPADESASTVVAEVVAPTSTLPPSGTYLMALSSRLRSVMDSAWASACTQKLACCPGSSLSPMSRPLA